MAQTKIIRWIAGSILVSIIAGSCGTSPADVKPMSLRMIQGAANILRDGERLSVTDQSSIQVGDRINVRRGIAEIRLEGGSLFEIEDAVVRVSGGEALILDSGHLLADIKSAVHVTAQPVTVEASSGAFRVDRTLAIRVASYSGDIKVRGEGRELKVSRYRQAVVSGGVVPTAQVPLRLTGDRWDRRYLQQAIDLDQRLINFGRGLEAQLGLLTGISFFRSVVAPDLDLEFISPFLEMRRADLLIAMVIASEAGGLDKVGRVISLWQEGGSWGLIAYELGVGQENMFSRLLEVVQRAGLTVVSRPTGPRAAGGGGANPPPSSPSPRPTDAGPSPSPSVSPSPKAPVPSPLRSPLPPEEEETIDEVVCGLIGAICSP